MPAYSTFNRLSLTQLYLEDRKQRSHLKRISEMQRHSGLDNGVPLRFPQLHQNFVKKLDEKRQEIGKENEIKSKKIVQIMSTKRIQHPSLFHPTNRARHNQSIHSSYDNMGYTTRIAKAKGKYGAREWKKQYEQHEEHLRLSRDNKLFTPLDIGVNRQRLIKANSLLSNRSTTPASSSLNVFDKHDKKII